MGRDGGRGKDCMFAKRAHAASDAAPKLWRRLLPFAILSLLFAALGLAPAVREHLHVAALSNDAKALGPWAPLAIAIFAIVSPLAFIPRWPVAFLCGLIYGVGWGALLANVVSTLGAWLHFRLARGALGDTTARLRQAERWRAALADPHTAFLALFLLRAFPLSNFTATNLLAGALNMRGRVYLAATFLGMIPSTLLYACWGKLTRQPDARFYALLAGLFVALVIGAWLASRLLPRAAARGQADAAQARNGARPP
jgi:uncharacterized membrane protein YdjX (TVP38/TMEM64 family)